LSVICDRSVVLSDKSFFDSVMSTMLVSGALDFGTIPIRLTPRTLNLVFAAFPLSNQHYTE